MAGAFAVWFWQPLPPEIIIQGTLFIPLLCLLLTLCGAYAITTNRVLQRRLLAVGLSFGLALGATAIFQTTIAGMIVVALAIMTLGGMIMQEA
jgi:hypothetical protein